MTHDASRSPSARPFVLLRERTEGAGRGEFCGRCRRVRGAAGAERRGEIHVVAASQRGAARKVDGRGEGFCGRTRLEPTSDLDPRGRREFKELLAAIPATKLIATHDLELVVELCPRSLLLDGGRLVADGPTVQLLSDEALMWRHGLEKPHILQHRHPHGQG